MQPMFFEILRFELRQQLRAPLFWIIAFVFAALAFLFASTDAVVVGGASGNALRKRAYLGGRFAAGYLVMVAIMLLCALGLAAGGSMPWVDAARLGPPNWHGYAWAFGVMVLPNLLFIAAVLFLLATATRSLLATLIGVIAFIVLLSIAKLLTQDVNNHALAAILDPFGGRTLQIVTRYWAPEQINRQLPPLAGLLLFNRLLWSGVAVLLAGTAFALFRADR